MKIRALLIAGILLGLNGSCSHPADSCPFERFEFFLLDSKGNSLLTSVNQNLTVYYIDNGRYDLGGECRECKMIRQTDNGDFYYSTVDACQLSARKQIQDFYIETNGDVDTVHLTAGFVSKCVKIIDATFNGQPAFERRSTPTMVYTTGFVFKKK
jgi:hypothetical protein